MFSAAKTRLPNLGRRIKPYTPSEKLVVRDSLDDDISDIEDDVFIRDGRSGKGAEETGLKRPLMAPRRKHGKIDKIPIMKQHKRCWRCCEPFCYGLAAVTIIIALILLAAFLISIFPLPIQKIKVWFNNEKLYSESRFNLFMSGSTFGGKATERAANTLETIPCNLISAGRVWQRVITKVNSETPVRKVDVNGDGFDDVVFGYGIDETQPDDQHIPLCTSLKSGLTNRCEGGLIALNGANGEILWQRWTTFTIFSIICSADINEDGQLDCVISGRGGLVAAINGRSGDILWELKDFSELETIAELIIDLYTISLVRDLDGDGVVDIVAVHVEEEINSRGGHIKLISGRTGVTIHTIPTPSREEVFVPVQFLTQKDGTELLLIATGGQSSAGGIYLLRLHTFMEYEKDYAAVYQSEGSGFMVPAVLTDINGDGIEDIIVAAFNSTVFAFDGVNQTKLWSYNFLASESVNSIVPGHFDGDNVTDFMVKFNTGPGFPIYYYSQTLILSGATGQPFSKVILDSGGPNSVLAGLSLQQTFGGDFFLHWQIECQGKPDAKDAYQFIPDSDIIQQSRADTCRLRYNTSTIVKLYALNRHMEPPGAVLFSTEELTLRLNTTVERSPEMSIIAPIKHPKMKLIPNRPTTTTTTESPRTTTSKMSTAKKIEQEEMPPPASFAEDDNTNVIRKNFPNYGRRKGQPQYGNFGGFSNGQDVPQDENGKPYIYLPYQQQRDEAGYALPNVMRPGYQLPQRPEDYEDFYSENNQIPRYPVQQPNYLTENRGVRSKNEVLTQPRTTPPNVATPRARTLWDLEVEKERKEALDDPPSYGQDSGKRRRAAVNDPLPEILPTISSTGTLIQSLNTSNSHVDYVFILNVRESEDFPPLYLQEDYDCVQEKMQGYKSYLSDELEKKFLIQCLKNRLPNYKARSHPKFETQIVITRLTLACGCEDKIDPGRQVCSKLSDMERQRWTGYMGARGNGIYGN